MDLQEMDNQLGQGLFPHKLCDVLLKHSPKNGIAHTAILIKNRKRRIMSIKYKCYAFKVAYYIVSKNLLKLFLNDDEKLLFEIYYFADCYRSAFTTEFGDWIDNIPLSFLNDNGKKFNISFLQNVNCYIQMMVEWENDTFAIPSFHLKRNSNFTNLEKLFYAFMEDLYIDEYFNQYNYLVNYYSYSDHNKLVDAMGYFYKWSECDKEVLALINSLKKF